MTETGLRDGHGYGRLVEMLSLIEADLRAEGREVEADAIHHASRFASGSPSELLGESQVALERLLQVGAPLPKRTRALALEALRGIRSGFRAVGGG